MKLTDVRRLKDLAPQERALQALKLGTELQERRREPLARGRLPQPLRTEKLGIAGPALQRLHGMAEVVPERVTGLRETGSLRTFTGEVVDLVLTPQARKVQGRRALLRSARETVEQLAVRQLALAMLDSAPIPRLCAAYAYWQATGAAHVVVPILSKGIESKDEEEFTIAAYSLGKVRPQRLSRLVGSAEDDRPNSPSHPQTPSMTIIIHGTFARDKDWYKPGGGFHQYIGNRVYPDVYSGSDFFFWSGRYSHAARRAAATKLVAWCASHPVRTLRLIAHSHGANVVNIATTLGLRACTLIHLSPPVHDRYLPQIANLSSQRFFTIRPRIDLVVWIDGGRQDYRGTPVAPSEKRRICARSGHSKSHDRGRWDRASVPNLVRSVCR